MERRKFTREFELEAVRLIPSDPVERNTAALAPNVLDRSFEAAAPNRKWIADFTYVWTAEGWLYVAAFHLVHEPRSSIAIRRVTRKQNGAEEKIRIVVPTVN